jgi:hypothetical protein
VEAGTAEGVEEGEGREGRCVRGVARLPRGGTAAVARPRFLLRPWVKPRPRVNVDAGERPDGHFHPKTSVMTSLARRACLLKISSTSTKQNKTNSVVEVVLEIREVAS